MLTVLAEQADTWVTRGILQLHPFFMVFECCKSNPISPIQLSNIDHKAAFPLDSNGNARTKKPAAMNKAPLV